MNALSRIIEDASRSLAPVRGPRLGDERYASARADVRRVDDAPTARSTRYLDDDVELLGARGGGRGRPVISVPSSAFFAQHLGQNPEFRNHALEKSSAEIAYRDASDLGVTLHRPEPLSLAV